MFKAVGLLLLVLLWLTLSVSWLRLSDWALGKGKVINLIFGGGATEIEVLACWVLGSIALLRSQRHRRHSAGERMTGQGFCRLR